MKRHIYTIALMTMMVALMGLWGTNSASATVSQSTNELIFGTVRNVPSITKTVTIQNTGGNSISVTALNFTGNNPSLFQLVNAPSLPAVIQPTSTLNISVRFTPSSNDVGTFNALLNVVSNDASSPTVVALYGLSQQQLEGNNEPPLSWVVETLGYNIDVGGTGLILNPGDPFFAPIGDEVLTPVFEKAGAGVMTLTPVLRYSPNETLPFGWYTRGEGNATTLNPVDVINLGQYQSLLPTTVGGNVTFDPGNAHFGIYVYSNSFNRASYTEDDLNTGPSTHPARVFPLKNRQGVLVPNAYLVVYEDAANGDYQDYGFVLTNARPAQDDPTPPSAPTGLNASGDLSSIPVTPQYQWNHVANATWYQTYVTNNAGYLATKWYQVGVDVTCTTTCSIVSPENLPKNGAYDWWVLAWNNIGSAWSTKDTFNVTVPVPSQPTGLDTEGSLVSAPVVPAFEWAHDSASSWYLLQLNGPSGTLINRWFEVGNTVICSSTCSVSPNVTLSNGAYQWWVQGWNEVAKAGAWSATANFAVAVPAPAEPTGLQTIGNLVTAPVMPTFEWGHDGISTWYEFYLSGPNGKVLNQWYQASGLSCGGICTLDPSLTLANGAYQWWVRGWNESQGSGVWNSSPANFTVAIPPPPAPTGLNVTNTGNVPATPTFEWNHSAGTSWYEVYVSGANGIVLNQWFAVGNGVTCGGTCTITPALSLPAGEYQWWVRGWNASVGNGPWNAVADNFTVSNR